MPELDVLEPSDLVLAARCRAGDAQAFGVLWERHYGAVRAAAARMTSKFDPDDLAQEAFTRTLSALRDGKGPTDAVRPYLYAALRSVSIAWAGTQRPVEFLDEIEHDAPDEIDLATSSAERSITATAFRGLPDEWRSVLWYTEVEGMAPAEASVLLGLSANATAALAYRAREGLRRAWLQAHVTAADLPEECRWFADRVGAYQRGGLTQRQKDRADEHLTGCLRCSLLLEEIDEVGQSLRLILLPLLLGAGIVAVPPVAAGPVPPMPAALLAGTGTAATAGSAAAAGAGAGSPVAAGTPVGAGASGGATRSSRTSLGAGAVAAAIAAVVGIAGIAAAVTQPWRDDSGQQVTEPTAAPQEPTQPSAPPAEPAYPDDSDEPSEPAATAPAAPPATDTGTTTSGGTTNAGAGTAVGGGASSGTGTPAPTPAPTPDPTPEPAPPRSDAPTVVTAPSGGAVVALGALTGTGTPGALVELRDDAGALVGSATVAPDGTWSLTPAIDREADGTDLLLALTQTAPGSAPSAPVELGPFVLLAPTLTSPAPGASVVDGGTVELSLGADATDTVEVAVDGAVLGRYPVTGGVATVASGLPLGSHTLTLRYVDADGNVGAGRTTAAIDVVAPDAPVVTTAGTDPAGTVTWLPLLSGTGMPGAAVTVTDDAGTVAGSTTVGTDGTWSLVVGDTGRLTDVSYAATQRLGTGTASAASAPTGAYTYDVPTILSPTPGEVLPAGAANVTFSGTSGAYARAIFGGTLRSLHHLEDAPLVRSLGTLTPGTYTVGLRYEQNVSAPRFGPFALVTFTVQ